MEVIICLSAVCIIAAILIAHFSTSPKRPDEMSRVEARYFERDVAAQQSKDWLKAEQEAELYRQKGLVDEFSE